MSGSRLRKDTRAIVSLIARYRSPTTFEFVEEECYDLSVGGMFVKSEAPAPAGTLLKLECELEGRKRIKGVARVVWLRRDANEHGPRGMGVKFVKLEGQAKGVISEVVRRFGEQGHDAPSMSVAPEARAGEAQSAPRQQEEEAIVTKTMSGISMPQEASRPEAAVHSSVSVSETRQISDAPAAVTQTRRIELEAKRSSDPHLEAGVAVGATTLVDGSPAAVPHSDPPIQVEAHEVEPGVIEARPSAAHSVPPPLPSEGSQARDPAQPRRSYAGVHARFSEPALTGEVLPAGIDPNAIPFDATTAKAGDPANPTGGGAWSVPPNAGWWKPWAWTAGGVAVFLLIVSSDWFLGENTEDVDLPLPAIAAANQNAANPEPGFPEAVLRDEAPPATAPAATSLTTTLPKEPETAAKAEPVQPAVVVPLAAVPPAAAATPAPAVATRAEAAQPSAARAPAPAPAAARAEAATSAPAAASAESYAVEITTSPVGANVVIGDEPIVAPGRVELGAFSERVRVAAEKPGYQSVNVWLDRTGFSLENGVMVRRMYLALKPSSTKAAKTPTAAASPAAVPVAAAVPAPAEPPAKPSPGTGSAMEIATACLGQGDNACVIDALEGKAKTAREYELLIETLRVIGRTRDAQKYMATYIEKFPDERRASSYKRTLALQAGRAAPEAKPEAAARAEETVAN